MQWMQDLRATYKRTLVPNIYPKNPELEFVFIIYMFKTTYYKTYFIQNKLSE